MYTHVFVGGTFDQLHKGHEALILHAFAQGDRVTVGLTSDEFVQKFRPQEQVASFANRKQKLLDFLSAHGFENRCELIAIDDPYEPAASMEDLDALMVTKDNRSRGEEINARREAKGLRELALIDVSLVVAQDAKAISASRIRNGEIDADGRLTMPDALRPELARPLGEILTGDKIGSSFERNRGSIIITVGDITTKNVLTAGIMPNLAIVDFQVARKPFHELEYKLQGEKIRITSGPGFIAKEAIEAIQRWKGNLVIVVDGEEDLLTLPAVAYGPVGAVVYYGQPDQGLVEVVITKEKQDEAIALLSQFDVK